MTRSIRFRNLAALLSFLFCSTLVSAGAPCHRVPGLALSGIQVTGAAVSNVTAQEKNLLGIEVEPVELSRGVKIKSVLPDGPGARSGFQEGDIITTINGQMIFSVDRYREVVSALAPGESISIRLQRGREIIAAEVDLKAE